MTRAIFEFIAPCIALTIADIISNENLSRRVAVGLLTETADSDQNQVLDANFARLLKLHLVQASSTS